MSRTLTARQTRFIHEYLVDYNGAAAARRAGYAAKNCRVQASQLLRHEVIGPTVRAGMADLLAELKVSARDTLASRAKVAYFDPGVLFDEAGAPLPLRALDAGTRALLAVSYELRGSGPVLKVRPNSREAAFAALERAQRVAMRELERGLEVEVAPAPVEAALLEAAAPPRVLPELDRIPSFRAMQAQPEAPVPVPPIAPEIPNIAPPLPEPPKPPEGDPGIVPRRPDPVPVMPPPREPGGGVPENEPAINPPRREPGQPAPQQVQGLAVDETSGQASKRAPRRAQGVGPRLAQAAVQLAAQQQARREAKQAARVTRQEPAPDTAPVSIPASAQAAAVPDDAVPRGMAPGAIPQAAAPTTQTRLPARGEPGYDYRKDPDLMWGGRRGPTPEPEPNPLIEQHIANVRAAEQRAELFGKFGNPNDRIRAGMPQRPPGVDAGYNPPHLRRDSRNGRPQYAIGAGECSFDGYGGEDDAVM